MDQDTGLNEMKNGIRSGAWVRRLLLLVTGMVLFVAGVVVGASLPRAEEGKPGGITARAWALFGVARNDIRIDTPPKTPDRRDR